MIIKKTVIKKTVTKKDATLPAPVSASGTLEIDGKTYTVKGHATLPTFKIPEETPTLVQFDGEMAARQKFDKNGPEKDKDGNPAVITVARVVKPSTGEVGTIVCGAVLVRALKDYPGGYIGKQFVLTKHQGETGKAKQWSVVEVSI